VTGRNGGIINQESVSKQPPSAPTLEDTKIALRWIKYARARRREHEPLGHRPTPSPDSSAHCDQRAD